MRLELELHFVPPHLTLFKFVQLWGAVQGLDGHFSVGVNKQGDVFADGMGRVSCE